MKVTCCCFTCIIGEEKNGQKEESSHLLRPDEENDERPKVHDKQPSYSRSTSAVSSASTSRGLSTESGDPISESIDGGSNKFSKAVGVLKKYNVMSTKYNSKELQRQLSSPAKLRLKIGFKIMLQSSTAKVSVIEAHDIMPILQMKGLPDMGSSTEQEQGVIIQVRTKIMHSEVRGHTKKYEMRGGITGALKLRNETIHTMDLEEFMRSKIRFRLYYVMKHQRDKLLGEYTLDIASLNIDSKNPVTQTMLELYDPSLLEPDTGIKSPGLTPVTNRMLSVESQPSTDKDSQSASTPKIKRQPKIRSQDSEARMSVKKDHEKGSLESLPSEKSEEESAFSKKKGISKALKNLRTGMMSKDQNGKEKGHSVDIAEVSEQLSVTERLRMAVSERGEKVEELEETTAAMADSASNFSELSVKLKEKYMAQAGGKKSKSSES